MSLSIMVFFTLTILCGHSISALLLLYCHTMLATPVTNLAMLFGRTVDKMGKGGIFVGVVHRAG